MDAGYSAVCNKTLTEFPSTTYLGEIEPKTEFGVALQAPRHSANSIYAFQSRYRDLAVGISGQEIRETCGIDPELPPSGTDSLHPTGTGAYALDTTSSQNQHHSGGSAYMTRSMSTCSYINSSVDPTTPYTPFPAATYLTDKLPYYYSPNPPASSDILTPTAAATGHNFYTASGQTSPSSAARYRVHAAAAAAAAASAGAGGGNEFDPTEPPHHHTSFSFHTGHPHHPPPRIFPSMNINVSMKMNLGLHTAAGRPYECYYESGANQYTSQTHLPQLTPSTSGAGALCSPRGYGMTEYGISPREPHSHPHHPQYHHPYYNMPYASQPPIDELACTGIGHGGRRGSGIGGGASAEISQLLRHPGQEEPNLCRICGKVYARPSTLKTHMRTHSGERPFKCSLCNKTFSQAANLTAHMRTHSGDKPFRCQVCDRRFSQSSSVTTHMRTHSGERPYRCRMCRKAFSDSSTLTKHLRVHSGDKPYQCKRCLIRFSQSGNLNRHMRIHASNPGHGVE